MFLLGFVLAVFTLDPQRANRRGSLFSSITLAKPTCMKRQAALPHSGYLSSWLYSEDTASVRLLDNNHDDKAAKQHTRIHERVHGTPPLDIQAMVLHRLYCL